MGPTQLYLAWILLFLISLPLALGAVRPNRFYGFRIAETMADPEVWRRGNTFAGRILLVGALIGGSVTRFWPVDIETWGPLLFVGIVCVATAIAFAYIKRIAR